MQDDDSKHCYISNWLIDLQLPWELPCYNLQPSLYVKDRDRLKKRQTMSVQVTDLTSKGT